MIASHQKFPGYRSVIWLSAMAALALATAKAEDSTKPLPEDVIQPSGVQADPGQYNNVLKLGIGSFFVNGDDSQFKYRRQLPDGVAGGIEELHLEKMLGSSKWLLQLDGRAIFDNHDYMVKLDLSNPEVGYLRGGYTEFRTWYDGSGGYYPGGNGALRKWVSLYNEDLHIDRGDAWVEAGLTLPDWPVLKFRYDYQFRDGTKDSTSWGEYNVGTLNTAGQPAKKIVPTFLGIDEKRHIIAADLSHTLGNTDFGVGIRFETLSQDDSRNIHRRPLELANNTGGNRIITQKDGLDSDMFNVHASTETRVSENTLFTVGYSYTKFDTEVSGSRLYGSGLGPYDPPFLLSYPGSQQRDHGFRSLAGGSQVEQHLANINLLFTPLPNWSVVPALRIEEQKVDSLVTDTALDMPAAGGVLNLIPSRSQTQHDFLDVSGSLDLRYTGFKDWSLYARGELLGEQGSLLENSAGDTTFQRNTDNNRLSQKYSIGANWYPCLRANLSGQYYYKKMANNYKHLIDPTTPATPGLENYPGFILDQNYDMHDVNFRVTLHAAPGLTLVSRYDFQLTTYDMKGDYNNGYTLRLNDIQSAQRTNHIFSQSLSWMPHPRLYLTGTFSYVFDETKTPAVNQIPNLLQNSKNTYWYGDAHVGFAMTEKTDLQLGYTYYHADNYQPFANPQTTPPANYGMPYGASNEEHTFSATVAYQIKPNILWKLKYGFFKNADQTSGDNNNYDAHLVYSSFEFRF